MLPFFDCAPIVLFHLLSVVNLALIDRHIPFNTIYMDTFCIKILALYRLIKCLQFKMNLLYKYRLDAEPRELRDWSIAYYRSLR